MRARFSSKFSGGSARERFFSTKNNGISRMLRTGRRFSLKISGCSARERNFPPNFQDAPQRSAIFFQTFRMLRTGAQFSSKSSECPHGSAISSKISGCCARERHFSKKLSGCSARERNFIQNLDEEDELARRSLIENWHGIHPVAAQILNDDADESYTNPIPETSA